MGFGLQIKKNTFLIIIIILAIYVGLTLYVDIEKFAQIIVDFDFRVIPIVLLLMSTAIIFLAIRYHRLLNALGIKIPIKKSIQIYFVGLAFSITPFSSGSVIKSHLLKKEFGFDISKTMPVVFVEKWNELNSVIILLVFTAIIHSLFETWIITIIGSIISILFIGSVKSVHLLKLLKKLTNKIKFLKKFENEVENSYESFNIIMNLRNTLEGLGLTTISKILEAIAVFIIFYGFGLELSFEISTQVYFVGILSGFISFIPGGFVVTEATMLGLLSTLIHDFALVTAAVILVRLNTIWFVTLSGLFVSKFFIK